MLDAVQGFIRDVIPPELLASIVDVGSQVLLYVSIVAMIAIVLCNTRFVQRYLYHKIRMMYLQGMVWNEVVYVGSINEEELVGSIGLADNMRDIMPSTTGKVFGFFHWYRPLVSVLIRKDAEDEQTYLYIGMSKRGYKENSLHAWAQGANCSVEPIDFEDIGFKPLAPFTAVVDNYTPSRFTNAPTKSTIGNAISRIQGMNHRGAGGSVLISYEPMVRTEQNLLENHILGENSADGVYARIIDQVESFTGLSPSRGVAIGFSDNGDVAESESILKVALDALPNKGFDEDRRSYQNLLRRSGVSTIAPSALLGVGTYFGIVPLWVAIPAAVTTLLALSGLSFLSSYWISQAASQGAAPIPPFRKFSPRRYFEQWTYTRFTLQGRRSLQQDSEKGRSSRYVARPSTQEILPLYHTSVMQLTSMPQNAGRATNVSKSVIPQVAMPTSVNTSEKMLKFIEQGDVVYEGISAKSNEPVYHTLVDVNFGVAFGGDAGSGKTNALMNHFVGVSRLSRKTTGYMGKTIKSTGETPTINPIWFETKSDEIDDLVAMVKHFDPLVLKIHNTQSPSRLALEGGRLGDPGVDIQKVEENKNVLIASMQAIWGDSFGPQSKRVADYALMLAYLLDKEGLDYLEFTPRLKNPDRPNIIHLMYLLINGDASLRVDKALAEYAKMKRDILYNSDRLSEYKATHSEADILRLKTMLLALDGLINLYSVPNAVAPLQNKLPQLLKSHGLFETVDAQGESRKEYSLDKLYTYNGPVIVDMTPRGSSLAPSDTMVFTMMVHYLLWQRIRMTAGGWGGRLKFTPIYADEITNFTGRADDNAPCATIIGEVRDQGRSYGVSHNVGFQNFSQMPRDTKNAVLSFTSKVYFKFGNKDDQEEVVRQMSSPLFTESNVRSFPQGVGIAQVSINNTAVSEFVIKTPYVKTWVEALQINEDVELAFESIRDDEIAMLKRERKKKVDSASTEQKTSARTVPDLPSEDPDGFDDDIFSLNTTEDDERPRLSWGGDS